MRKWCFGVHGPLEALLICTLLEELGWMVFERMAHRVTTHYLLVLLGLAPL